MNCGDSLSSDIIVYMEEYWSAWHFSCRSPVRGTSSLKMVFLSRREGSQLKINKAAICLQQPHRALALSHFHVFISVSHFSVHFYFLLCFTAIICHHLLTFSVISLSLISLTSLWSLFLMSLHWSLSLYLSFCLQSVSQAPTVPFSPSLLSSLYCHVSSSFSSFIKIFSPFLFPSLISLPLISALLLLTAGSDGKESSCKAGHPVSIPGLGRSPGEGNSNPL